MILLPQTRRARLRRNCGGFLSMFDSKTSTANTSTTVAVDSYNRAFNSVRNNSNAGNQIISVGGENPFDQPGEKIQRTALYVIGALGIVALLAWFLGKGK